MSFFVKVQNTNLETCINLIIKSKLCSQDWEADPNAESDERKNVSLGRMCILSGSIYFV